MANEQEILQMNEEENHQDEEENLQDDEDDAEISKQFMEEQKRAAEIMKLPQAPIDRIVREMLPPGIHVSKETRAVFSRAVSVFIICLGTAAHDSALAAKRKSIMEKDVISALKKMHLNIPEITTLLDNFKANMEREKQAKKSKATEKPNVGGVSRQDTIAEENLHDDVQMFEPEAMDDVEDQ